MKRTHFLIILLIALPAALLSGEGGRTSSLQETIGKKNEGYTATLHGCMYSPLENQEIECFSLMFIPPPAFQ
ncbi:MAG: hypothetical protein Q4D56_06860 [Bacteroides sp.]|nr:hypothetical protein [Bacteroides sp.]